MKKPIMLFMSKDVKELSKRDLDNGAIRESLFKTLRWYEALCASQQAGEANAKVADMNKLYKLKLHEIYCPDNNSLYRRVPGGWVYGDLSGICFVPLDNEFQRRPNQPLDRTPKAAAVEQS